MSKIVRTFVETTRAPSYSLMREIAAGEQLDEAGMLTRLANSIGAGISAAKTAFSGTPPPPPPPDPSVDTHSKATKDDASSDLSKLRSIVGDVLEAPSGEVRFVLHLSHKDLVSLYLKSGGGQAVVGALPDPEITSLVANPLASKSRLAQLKNDFKFSDLLDPVEGSAESARADQVVLLDIPGSLVSELKAAGTDLEKAKIALKKMMSFKYYVLTLNKAKAKAIAPAMGTAEDLEKQIDVFDPNVIENYPIKQDFIAAKMEWAKEHSEGGKKQAEVDSKVKQGEDAKLLRQAEDDIAGPASKIENGVLATVMQGTDDAGKVNATQIVQGLYNKYNSSVEKEEMLKVLRALQTKLGSRNIGLVVDEMTKKNWIKK